VELTSFYIMVSITKTGLNVRFKQHASASTAEEANLNIIRYTIIDVVQKLNTNYNDTSGNLGVSSFTNIFPSATLKVNGFKIMQYDKPSFEKPHGVSFFDSIFSGSYPKYVP